MIPRLIDSHCHLDYVETDALRTEVMNRARATGVEFFVCIGAGRGMESNAPAIALAEREKDVAATVGVHPHDAAIVDEAALEAIAEMAKRPRVVAIGEVGLDYHYDHSPREKQRDAFRRFIALARAANKPLVIHTRNAAEDTLALLREENARDVGGVIHCFSEDAPFARAALELDFDISFSGIVTFKKSEVLRDVAKMVPRDRILIETDAPYLAPVPMRGKTNEPAYVEHTARALADVLSISPEELALRTRDNAIRRFRLNELR